MHHALTPRENQILALLVSGLANKQIATSLNISQHTVSNAIGRIFLKTHTHCRTQLAVWAVHQTYLQDGRTDEEQAS